MPFSDNFWLLFEMRSPCMDLYRDTLRGLGLDESIVAQKADACWAWRNVFVAETDAEAERLAPPAFLQMHEHRAAMRERVFREQGLSILPMPAPGATPPAHTMLEHSLVCGSPATVIEKLSAVGKTGIGGLIMQFRLGALSYEHTAQSLTMFRDKVMPHL